MTRVEKFSQWYREADWIAHLVLMTCCAASLNFLEILRQTMAAAAAAGTHVVDGYEITVCYFGPPASFYPRLLVLLGLLIASVAILGRTVWCRFITAAGLTVSLGTYVYWWLHSYHVFRNFENFLDNGEIKQFAYLYQGTPLDVGVALSLMISLVIVLDRLIRGETSIELTKDTAQP